MGSDKTIGEERVRIDSSNIGGSYTVVFDIKKRSAELITLCDKIKMNDPRLAAIAMTAFEEAAMWAVKLATTSYQPEGKAGVNTPQEQNKYQSGDDIDLKDIPKETLENNF